MNVMKAASPAKVSLPVKGAVNGEEALVADSAIVFIPVLCALPSSGLLLSEVV